MSPLTSLTAVWMAFSGPTTTTSFLARVNAASQTSLVRSGKVTAAPAALQTTACDSFA